MTTKQLQELIRKPPVHRTPDYLPLCNLALEVSKFADAVEAPEDTQQRALNFSYNVIEEITAQLHRVFEKVKPEKPAAPESAPPAVVAPTAPPVETPATK